MLFVRNQRRLALLGIDFAIIVAVYALTLLISFFVEESFTSKIFVYFANFFISDSI